MLAHFKEALMRRVVTLAAMLSLAWAGTVGHAQTMKIASPDDLGKAMEAIFFDFASANFSIVALAPADAQKLVASTKSKMTAVEAFWIDRKKDGPAKIARTAIEKLDAYEKAIAGGDRNTMAATVKEVGAQCGACHSQYRDQDPVTKEYRIKPGVL
jgi:hypothetical protein